MERYFQSELICIQLINKCSRVGLKILAENFIHYKDQCSTEVAAVYVVLVTQSPVDI